MFANGWMRFQVFVNLFISTLGSIPYEYYVASLLHIDPRTSRNLNYPLSIIKIIEYKTLLMLNSKLEQSFRKTSNIIRFTKKICQISKNCFENKIYYNSLQFKTLHTQQTPIL